MFTRRLSRKGLRQEKFLLNGIVMNCYRITVNFGGENEHVFEMADDIETAIANVKKTFADEAGFRIQAAKGVGNNAAWLRRFRREPHLLFAN